MTAMLRTATALLCLALPVHAQTVEDVLAEAAADCAGFESGTFSAAPTAITTPDLTGDGQPDTVVDYAGFACSTVASMWGGTGGSSLSVLAGGKRFDFLALGWQVIDWAGPVLLLDVHGIECNGTGSDRCVKALVWGGDRFMSVQPPGE
jgi:hypothetical protein